MSNKKTLTIKELEDLWDIKQSLGARRKADHVQRRKDILELHLVQNLSLAQIAKRYGITRQRVFQIINNTN